MAISVTFRFEEAQCFADITQDSATPTTVFIGKYSKVITEREQTINLTPYLREMFKYSAPTEEGDLRRDNRAVLPVVTIDGVDYYANRVYNGSSNMAQVATKLPYRLIAPRQTDVLYCGNVYDDEGVKIYYNSTQINGETPDSNARNAISILSMRVGGITQSGDVKVQYYHQQGGIISEHIIRYVVKPMGLNGVRLAWINELGGVDMWNFDHLREQDFAATSETIYTHNGYTKLNTAAERRYTVETRELTTEALNAMSYIIASPAVWVVTDDGAGNTTFEEVDVVTEECKVFNDAELLGLQVSYRPKKRVL